VYQCVKIFVRGASKALRSSSFGLLIYVSAILAARLIPHCFPTRHKKAFAFLCCSAVANGQRMTTLRAQTRKYPPTLFGAASEDEAMSPREKGILSNTSPMSLRMSVNEASGSEDVICSNSAASGFSNNAW
jgi:hypothetical protein